MKFTKLPVTLLLIYSLWWDVTIDGKTVRKLMYVDTIVIKFKNEESPHRNPVLILRVRIYVWELIVQLESKKEMKLISNPKLWRLSYNELSYVDIKYFVYYVIVYLTILDWARKVKASLCYGSGGGMQQTNVSARNQFRWSSFGDNMDHRNATFSIFTSTITSVYKQYSGTWIRSKSSWTMRFSTTILERDIQLLSHMCWMCE